MTDRDIVTPYQEALDDGRLLIQQCQDCKTLIMYPRHRCTNCQSANLGWTPAEGTGTLLSWTIQRVGAPSGFEDELPYALGIIRLNEGVQMLARLAPGEDGANAYSCDAAVRFVPAPARTEGRPAAAWFKVDA